MKGIDFNVGVIGSGKMGTSLVGFLLDFGIPVTWICEEKKWVEELRNLVEKKITRSLKAGIIDRNEYKNRLKTIVVSHSLQELKKCNLIIETITEDINRKQKLFEKLDLIAKEDCIFASNSSSISPENWYLDGKRKDRIVGMHFFSPVPFTNIVELITTRNTSQNTLQTACDFLNLVNKKFMIQEGESAFLLNRVFLDFQAGAYRLCKENSLSFGEMDKLIVRDFFPVGVFELFDRVGIDVIHFSIKRYTENAGNKEFYRPLLDQMGTMIESNILGMKTGQGFYSWEGQQIVIPEKGDQSQETNIPDMVSFQLKEWYIKAAKTFVEKGYCTKSDLDYAVKEYMNCDKGPFEL